MRALHKITVPYIVRFIWASTEANKEWEKKIGEARAYLINRLPSLLVESGAAKFAPTTNTNIASEIIGDAMVANHYHSRWSTIESNIKSYPSLVRKVGVVGDYNDISFPTWERWDLLRDLYQLALAPDCCKQAYFNSDYKDPYHDLYDGVGGKLKRISTGAMNSLHAPLGLFVSPIVPCKLDCEHAKQKAMEIESLILLDNKEIHDTLIMVVEMPFRIDSYRGNACVDTPMFKGVFATDAYKESIILDAKPNAEHFNYGLPWVAKGARFPFKGQFSDLFGGKE